MVDRPVRALYATADALVVQVDEDPWQLRHLGVDTYDVVRSSRYLQIRWGSKLPQSLTITEDVGSERRPAGILTSPTNMAMSWYEQTADPRAVLHAEGSRWRLGRISSSDTDTYAPWHHVLATAHEDDDRMLRRFDLGAGIVVTARAIADDTAVGVAIRRPGSTFGVELLSLQKDRPDVTTLLAADALDITDLCWPVLTKPLEADSYEAQTLARNSWLEPYWEGADGIRPLARGMSEVATRLDGQWPETHIEWTFRWHRRPGARLRRRFRLYDELGRIVKPEFADIHLMEDLDTGAVPPAFAARDGFLDL